MPALKPSIFSVACIITASLAFYFQGYKDDQLLKTIICIVGFGGWLILYLSVTGYFNLFNAKQSPQKNNHAVPPKKSMAIIYCILFCALGIGNVLGVTLMEEKRVGFILNNEGTQTTLATVVGFDERHTKYNSKHYVIIHYTVNDTTIHQAIYDYKREYAVGQKIKIKYSVQYPAMFILHQEKQ